MLCMLLRKKLTGGRLKSIRQIGLDRVLFLDFDCKNELGDPVVITLAVEIMGRLSNIILLQDNKIIDTVRRFDPEEGKRFLLPGAAYEPPTAQDKLNILTQPASAVADRLQSLGDLPTDKALMRVLDGVSPIICRELALNLHEQAGSLTEKDTERLCRRLERFRETILSGGQPVLVQTKAGTPKDFTFVPVRQYGAGMRLQYFDHMGDLLDAFFADRENAERMRAMSASLLKMLVNASQRIDRKIAARQQDLKKTENREQLREYGELVKANLHSIHPGDSFVDAMNYYDPECKTVRIPLDPTLSPSKNAQKYFTNYRKAATAAGMLSDLIEKAKLEKDYIDSVFDALSRATSTADYLQIRQELCETGYLHLQNTKKQPSVKSAPLSFVSADGFPIFVGKNNKQNDQLTLKTADKTDIFMHVKNMPGSHVIIVTGGKEVPERTLLQGAVLAALHSKAAAGKQVPVDYTPVKYVKKPAGAKPGMVIYTTNKTIFADPDDTIYHELKGADA